MLYALDVSLAVGRRIIAWPVPIGMHPEAFGWRLDREKGSHVIFTKDGERSITVPKVSGRMVKGVYLDEICNCLGLDE